VTAALACFGLWGPRARDVLDSVADHPGWDGDFPFMAARELVVCDVPCLALRVTYVGEVGWELYLSVEFAPRLWDSLMEAGMPRGMVPAGYRAIDALRLEKGYRAWGSDISPDDTPFEAGLDFAVAMDKPSFIGKQALERARAAGAKRKLVCLVLDDPRSVALGNEPVRSHGRALGRVTSGGFGYAVGKSIAFAYLPAEVADVGTRVQVEVFGERVGAEVVREPLWDPEGERIKG
jgi:glycine cleavage system aminomethyltransferase T